MIHENFTGNCLEVYIQQASCICVISIWKSSTKDVENHNFYPMPLPRLKILTLSPDMTVSALKQQMQQLVGCDIEVYHHHEPAPPELTLEQIGFRRPASDSEVLQLPLDETWRVRDLEIWFEQECQLQVELGVSPVFSVRNKFMRLYQLRETR